MRRKDCKNYHTVKSNGEEVGACRVDKNGSTTYFSCDECKRYDSVLKGTDELNIISRKCPFYEETFREFRDRDGHKEREYFQKCSKTGENCINPSSYLNCETYNKN